MVETVRTLQADSCESPNFYSSSGPWRYHDGQDVWGPVKNNTGHVTSTHVYEFLSPLVHQV